MDHAGRRVAVATARLDRVALFYGDAREYNPVEKITEALHLTVAAQEADRIAVRCLRPLYRSDGSPIVRRDRPEQVRAVLAGVFDLWHLGEAAKRLAELDARAANDPRDQLGHRHGVGYWNSYVHCQRVIADVTNYLLPGRRGTVDAKGIGAYCTVPGDIDPSAGASPEQPIEIANDLAEVLVERLQIDPRALLRQQSGRGCYLNLNIEPQPLTAKPVIRDAIRTLAQLVAATGAAVQVDPSVSDAARILRLPATTNRKPQADPSTPSWLLQPWTPSVRVPWATIERLAVLSRPKLRVIEGGRPPLTHIAVHRPLLDLFRDHGLLYDVRTDGSADVKCPWAPEHTDGRDSAILFPPKKVGAPGWFHCLHAHCANRTLADVYGVLGKGPR